MSEIPMYPDECPHRLQPERCWQCLAVRVLQLEQKLIDMSAPLSPCPGCGTGATEPGYVRYRCHVCSESYIGDTPAQIAGLDERAQGSR